MKIGDDYPENKAIKVWKRHGCVLSVVHQDTTFTKHYCGYARFPKGPRFRVGYQGFGNYIVVHGGITYAKERPDGSYVYGFDCCHVEDDRNPKMSSINWLTQETENMAASIKIACLFEWLYIIAPWRGARVRVIDEYHRYLFRGRGIRFILWDNFGSMISALCGVL